VFERFEDNLMKRCVNRKFNLSDLNIGPFAAKAVKNILFSNSNIAVLNMSKNQIGDEGALRIAEYLESGTLKTEMNNTARSDADSILDESSKQSSTFRERSLTSSDLICLNLSENKISSVGASAIFKALKFNEHLISLNLGNTDTNSRNVMGPKASKYLKELLISNQVLTFLDVRYNNLGDQGMFQISQGLRKNRVLMQLSISQNQITSFGIDFLTEALSCNKESALVDLDISANQFGNKGIEYLVHYMKSKDCKLNSLNVSECAIVDKGMQTFLAATRHLSQLKCLHVSKNEIGYKSEICRILQNDLN
jgi:Ran GTPase-activating protein (RanGAP) involved in mRNA processing and transport